MMDVNQYFKEAKQIGEQVKGDYPSILAALNYDSEHDHPSQWIPNVQLELLKIYNSSPNSEVTGSALRLYVQGEILQNNAERNRIVKAGFICLVFGLCLGWLFWG